MITEDEAAKKVRTYFDMGYNCAESLLMILQEHMGLEIAPKVATGFGGGMARKRSVCGAVTGTIIAIGLKYGRKSENDRREPSYERIQRFWAMMEERYGTVICGELTALPQNRTRGTEVKGHHEICNRVVEDAVRYAIAVLKD